MFRKYRFIIACLCLNVPAYAQHVELPRSPLSWPAPTRESKPWTRWWWLGSAVDKPGLTQQIEELSDAGFGGVEVTVIYGAKGADSAYIPYLSPRWVDAISHTAAETRKHRMGLDLPQGSGWRTGGPSVTPEDANASLAIRVDTIGPGATWQTNIANRRINAILAMSDAGEHINIPVSGTTVRWTAPAGQWIVYTAETRFSGDNVKRPAPGGAGPSIDPFSYMATSNYLAMFSERMASLPRGAIRSYFHDSFEYTGDATNELFAAFKKHHGYELGAELPALAGHGDADHIARVKSDYRQTLDELLLTNFVSHLTKWSHARGSLMREQAHGSPGNLLDLYAASDIPETEIFGVVGGPDGDPLINKFASSAAHVSGRQLASAEAFTWLGEHFSGTLNEAKLAADRMFLAGINHLVYHGTAYSPANVPWPGWQFYASMEWNPRNAFWHDTPAFNAYVTRVQSFMQAGTADNDVLLYWPIADNWHDAAGKRMDFRVHNPVWFHSKPFGKLARTLHEGGYGVDYVSDRQLTNDITVTGARIRSRGGSYATIVVPPTVHMPPQTLARLLALARDGATVAFVGSLPSDVPGLARLSERRDSLTLLKTTLKWDLSDGGFRIAKLGRGRIISGDTIETLLARTGIQRDPLAAQSGLQIIRRGNSLGQHYFVVASKPVHQWVRLAGHPLSVVLLDPMSGRSGIARTRYSGGVAEVYLQLSEGQSMILRSYDAPVRGASWAYTEPDGDAFPLRGKWTVSFVSGGPVLPASFVSDTVTTWTGRGDNDADNFAGTARYTLTFDAPDAAARHLLSLGRIGESARVKLNGRELGTLFASPFQLETGPLKRTGNVLETEVTNVSANRVRDLDRRGVQWRNFNDINFVNIDYKPFDASSWPVRPAGLIGPVILQPLRR